MPQKTAESEISSPPGSVPSDGIPAGSGWLSPDSSIHATEGTRFAELFHPGDLLVTVAAPGRTGPAKLEEVRVRPFKGEILRLRLEGGSELLCAPGSLVYARISGCSSHWCSVLTRGPGNIWAIIFDRNPVSVTSLPGLLEAWILDSGPDRDETGYRGTIASLTHGVPFFDLTSRKIWPLPMGERLARDLDLPGRGRACLSTAGMLEEFPHFTNYHALGLKPLNLIMFSGDEFQVPGGSRRRNHRIHLDLEAGRPPRDKQGRDRHGRERATTDRASMAGHRGPHFEDIAIRLPGDSPEKWEMWNIDVTKEEYAELLLLARTFASLDSIRIVEKAIMSPGKTYVKFPVENLGPSMAVPFFEEDSVTEKRVASVDRIPFSGNLVKLRPAGLPLVLAAGTPVWAGE